MSNTDKVVGIIAENSTRNILSIPDDGLSATNRVLSVEHNGKSLILHAKLYFRRYQVLNEIVGYLLAHHLNLPQPKGYLLLLSPDEQKSKFNIQGQPKNTRPVWATESLDHKSAMYHFQRCSKALRDDLAKWFNLYGTVALDDWIANIDRNPGNLLRQSSGKYHLIDHGKLFFGHSIRSNYIHERNESSNFLEQQCLKSHVKNKGKNESLKFHHQQIASHAVRQSEAFNLAKSEILFWTSKFAKGHERKIYKFLSSRCDEYNHIIQQKYHLLAV